MRSRSMALSRARTAGTTYSEATRRGRVIMLSATKNPTASIPGRRNSRAQIARGIESRFLPIGSWPADPNGTMLAYAPEETFEKREEEHAGSAWLLASLAGCSDLRARCAHARRRCRAQSGSAHLPAAGPDQMESAERRRLAERGAGGRPVEAGALRRPQQVAQGQPFQQAALPSQRPLHHRPRRHLVDGQRTDVRSRQ